MAKLTRSNATSALADSTPSFKLRSNGITIGITASYDAIYHVHLSQSEAKQFAAFVQGHS